MPSSIWIGHSGAARVVPFGTVIPFLNVYGFNAILRDDTNVRRHWGQYMRRRGDIGLIPLEMNRVYAFLTQWNSSSLRRLLLPQSLCVVDQHTQGLRPGRKAHAPMSIVSCFAAR